MSDDNIFIQLLKKHTNIDKKFINTFFKNFEIDNELIFHIKDIDVAKYLNIKLVSLRDRLNNNNSNKIIYVENVDFIKKQTGVTSGVTYWLNYQGFERLAMNGDSEQSDVVRSYFIKLREFITNNQHIISQAVNNKDHLKKYVGFECVYFFVSSNKYINKLKLGITENIVQRLRNYNVGRINEVDLKYLAIVKNARLIESCLKNKLNDNEVIHNREIYEIDPVKLQKIIVECYCKYVSKKENSKLYDELAHLTELYSYTIKNKKYKPYIIINKFSKK